MPKNGQCFRINSELEQMRGSSHYCKKSERMESMETVALNVVGYKCKATEIKEEMAIVLNECIHTRHCRPAVSVL
jgi:hypothetical protein